MKYIKFNEAVKTTDRLIKLLHDLNINPKIGAKIESEFLSPLQLAEILHNSKVLESPPQLLANAGGIVDLAAKILSIENQPELKDFIPHLKIFSNDHTFSTAVQMKKGDIRDDGNRKMAELYLACLAVHFAFNVKLDHPEQSKGDNPDIIFDIKLDDNNKSTWTLAVKTISTLNGQTIFENIQKASRQIDSENCKADRGIVVINLKNSIDHDLLWGRDFASPDDAINELGDQITNIMSLAEKDRPEEEWTSLFSNKTSPLILYYAHAVVKLKSSIGKEKPIILKIMKWTNPTKNPDPVALDIAWYLNHYMQIIVEGTPGSNGTLPS
ncbi:TPA: hypothetical protein ACSTJ2_000194 [Serratia fonticola]